MYAEYYYAGLILAIIVACVYVAKKLVPKVEVKPLPAPQKIVEQGKPVLEVKVHGRRASDVAEAHKAAEVNYHRRSTDPKA